jgi:hypothetical protein
LTSKFKFVEILKNEITHSTSEQSGVISENSSSRSSKFSVPKIQYKEDNYAKIRQGKHDTFVFTIQVIQQPFSLTDKFFNAHGICNCFRTIKPDKRVQIKNVRII